MCLRCDKTPVIHDLPERQLGCLHWIAEGKTSAEIAIIMDLSVHTVNWHINSAVKALGAVNRAHAVACAMRLGLLR